MRFHRNRVIMRESRVQLILSPQSPLLRTTNLTLTIVFTTFLMNDDKASREENVALACFRSPLLAHRLDASLTFENVSDQETPKCHIDN